MFVTDGQDTDGEEVRCGPGRLGIIMDQMLCCSDGCIMESTFKVRFQRYSSSDRCS